LLALRVSLVGNSFLSDSTPEIITQTTPFIRLEEAPGAGGIDPFITRNLLLSNSLKHYYETGLSRQLTIHPRSGWASPHPTFDGLGLSSSGNTNQMKSREQIFQFAHGLNFHYWRAEDQIFQPSRISG